MSDDPKSANGGRAHCRCVCGVVSIATRRPYRIDWAAVVGICLGVGQLLLTLALFASDASGL